MKREVHRSPAREQRDRRAAGWTFLVAATAGRWRGDSPRRRAVGFTYTYIPDRAEWAHPAALIFLSDERHGDSLRVRHRVRSAAMMRESLILKAGTSEPATAVGFMNRCYHYDPDANNHSRAGVLALRIGAAGFVVLLIATRCRLMHFLRKQPMKRMPPSDVRLRSRRRERGACTTGRFWFCWQRWHRSGTALSWAEHAGAASDTTSPSPRRLGPRRQSPGAGTDRRGLGCRLGCGRCRWTDGRRPGTTSSRLGRSGISSELLDAEGVNSDGRRTSDLMFYRVLALSAFFFFAIAGGGHLLRRASTATARVTSPSRRRRTTTRWRSRGR